ncbi:MAG: DUF354 domain-containing protein, partial [Bacteroidales bacterium]|nr:DUF354 domain-containing protein [Bacteroidales bacterium]
MSTSTSNKLLFYFGHPAQFLMFRQTIKVLIEKGWPVKIVIKTKDVLETLVKESGFNYENILPQGRSHNLFSIFFAVLKRDFKMWKIARKFKPDIMIGTDPSIAHISWLTGAYGITIIEDDDNVIKSLVRMTYPFTKTILCPEVCRVGKYGAKKIGYAGYMKLGYLHPNVFKVDHEILNKYQFDKKFVLIRLSSLGAYHDYGIKGLTKELLNKIITKCLDAGFEIKLSAEFEIESDLKKYQLQIDPKDMHHILARASILISDSQSMSVEAAILGTPSIRYSGFAGRISVLEELETKYQLTAGIPIGQNDYLFSKLDEYLNTENLETEFQARRYKMLSEKIDVSAFLLWLLENYPQSIQSLKKDPE